MPVLVPDTAADCGNARGPEATLVTGLLVAAVAVLDVGRAGAVFSNGDAGRDSTGLTSRFGCSCTFFTGFGFGLGFGFGFSMTTGASFGGSGISSGSGSGSTTGSGGG